MNHDQTTGAARDAPPKAQRQPDKTPDNAREQAKALAKQDENKLQTAYGKVKEALKNSRHT